MKMEKVDAIERWATGCELLARSHRLHPFYKVTGLLFMLDNALLEWDALGRSPNLGLKNKIGKNEFLLPTSNKFVEIVVRIKPKAKVKK